MPLESQNFKTFLIIPYRGVQTLLMYIFLALFVLLAYYALNDLTDLLQLFDLDFFIQQFPSNINSGALSTLLDCIINQPKKEKLIWTTTNTFFSQKILIKTKSTSLPTTNSVIVGLYDAWHCFYLIDSLESLQQYMQDCIYDCSDYYTKTFIFV